MRKILVVISAVLTLPSVARSSEFCEAVGLYAGAIMGQRQRAVPLQEKLAALDPTKVAAREMREIILEAYSQPHYLTKEAQDRAVQDFQDNKQLACELMQPE